MKTIKIVPYGALPCEAAQFEIDGKPANKMDFGDNADVGSFDYEYGPLDDENWACADNRFVAHDDIPEGVLQKYGIDEARYREILSELAEKFNVGGCGWCV